MRRSSVFQSGVGGISSSAYHITSTSALPSCICQCYLCKVGGAHAASCFKTERANSTRKAEAGGTTDCGSGAFGPGMPRGKPQDWNEVGLTPWVKNPLQPLLKY